MKNVQMSALGNYQVGFQSKNNIVNLAKDSIKANATRYFRNIDGYEKSVLTSEEAEKVQSMLNKHLQKPERIEIKSPDGDTLFISNPAKEELLQLSKKAKQDFDEAVDIIDAESKAKGSVYETMKVIFDDKNIDMKMFNELLDKAVAEGSVKEEEVAQIIRMRELSLGFQPHPWDKYVDNV